nr:MAG TPA: hypothetical protein [Caudoviricetes sp.]
MHYACSHYFPDHCCLYYDILDIQRPLTASFFICGISTE